MIQFGDGCIANNYVTAPFPQVVIPHLSILHGNKGMHLGHLLLWTGSEREKIAPMGNSLLIGWCIWNWFIHVVMSQGAMKTSFMHFVVESALLCSSSLFHELINLKWMDQSSLSTYLFNGYENPALGPWPPNLRKYLLFLRREGESMFIWTSQWDMGSQLACRGGPSWTPRTSSGN